MLQRHKRLNICPNQTQNRNTEQVTVWIQRPNMLHFQQIQQSLHQLPAASFCTSSSQAVIKDFKGGRVLVCRGSEAFSLSREGRSDDQILSCALVESPSAASRGGICQFVMSAMCHTLLPSDVDKRHMNIQQRQHSQKL